MSLSFFLAVNYCWLSSCKATVLKQYCKYKTLPLIAFLFTLAVDWILQESTKGKKCEVQWTPWLQLEDLDFADDLALMSHTKHQMQSKTDTLDEISKSIGLNIHAGKSKILTSERDTIERVTLKNTPLEIVESFTYLGSIIDGKGGTEADVRTRIGKARTAFANLSNGGKHPRSQFLRK